MPALLSIRSLTMIAILLLCLLCSLSWSSALSRSAAAGVDVYICAGQSNMVGGVSNPPDELNTYNSPSLLQLGLWPGYNFTILQATEPLQEAFTNGQTGNVGPCMSFAATLLNKTGRISVLVPAAVQSTGFTTSTNIVHDPVTGGAEPIIGNWRPVGSDVSNASYYLYQRLITRASYLQQLGFRIAGMLWLQGEADVGEATGPWGPPDGNVGQTTAEHARELVILFQAIRTALQTPAMPVVLLQMAPRWVAAKAGNATSVQNSINLLPFLLPHSATAWSIEPDSGELLSPAPDEVHYPAPMQRVLGKLGAAAFEAALNNYNGSVPGPVLPSPVPNSYVAVQWAPDPQADGYIVYIRQSHGAADPRTVSTLRVTPSPTSPVQLLTARFAAPNATAWTVEVQAYNSYGNGPMSAAVTFPAKKQRVAVAVD